jgi:hypothetical protein
MSDTVKLPIIDESLLDLFRGSGRCHYCNKWCRRLEPHHLVKRGAGGWSRVDRPRNLIALGSAFDCGCHHNAENGKHPTYSDCLAIVAQREGVLQQTIIDEINELLWKRHG